MSKSDFLNQSLELEVSVGVSRKVDPDKVHRAIRQAVTDAMKQFEQNKGFPCQRTIVRLTGVEQTGW